MRVLVVGDRFITGELLVEAMDRQFQGSGIEFEYDSVSFEWPVVPVQENDELREFVGDGDLVAQRARSCDAEIILTHSGPVPRIAIESAPALRVVGAARGGPVNINWQACTERGIPVFYAPGRNSGAVAELTVALMLAETRSIVRAHMSLMKERRWRGDLYVLEKVGLEMNSAVIGLIGFGAIGQKVARIVAGFGASVIVNDPYVDPVTIMGQGYRAVSLDDLLREADIVSLHCRLTAETRGMIGEREIDLMKRTAYLINTARGELVQSEHLYKALKDGRIAGAGLDVFEAEPPPPESLIYQLDNVTATTHLGGASIQAAQIGTRILAGEVFNYLTGKDRHKYCVNPEVLAPKAGGPNRVETAPGPPSTSSALSRGAANGSKPS
jgi:D-3-phosphoglycerate dehydrogenase